MPFYEYYCRNCKRSLEVLRQFSEYETPPQVEELISDDPSLPAGCCNHDWERKVGGKQILQRGANWNGSKGNWGKV